jgi:hypothetical protein
MRTLNDIYKMSKEDILKMDTLRTYKDQENNIIRVILENKTERVVIINNNEIIEYWFDGQCWDYAENLENQIKNNHRRCQDEKKGSFKIS